MSDEATFPVNGQPADGQAMDPNKKSFFGGEVNFNDTNAFKAVDAPDNFLDFNPFEEAPEETPEASMEPKNEPSTETTENPESNIDPFEEQEITEAPETIETSEVQTDTTKEEASSPQPLESSTENNPEENPEEEIEEKIEEKSEEKTSEEPTIEQVTPQTANNPLIDKFLNLVTTIKQIFSLSEDQQSFKILWGKSDTSILEYFTYLVEDEDNHIDIFIKKVETNTITEGEDEHLLQRSYTISDQHLDIFVDELLLYQFNNETEQERSDENIEKLNKFWFLFKTYYEDLNKIYQEKQAAEAKKKQLHEIFRNF